MNLKESFDHCDRPVSNTTAELGQAAGRMAKFHRISWKEAFGEIASPAFRLHRYRIAHNRLLHSALCNLDCRDARNRKR